MITIGSIGFMQPWILAALAALPAIWWLLRFTPPSPHVVVFPPTRLLKDLKTTEEEPAHSPWWLTALRMLLAALLILALARPVLNPDRQAFAGTGPLVLIVDNGWASAAEWPERREAIEAAIDRAGRDGRTIVFAPTAPGQPVSDPLSPDEARERLAGLTPQPYAPDRAALAATLERNLAGKTDYSVLWLSDGLDYGEGEALTDAIAKLRGQTGSFAMLRPGKDDSAIALGQAAGEGAGLAARVLSTGEGAHVGVVKAVTARGEPLGDAQFSIADGTTEAAATFDLPLEIRNQVARLEIAGERSAGAVYLMDARSQWHRVGIVSGESREAAQPLLSPLYYVQRALAPYADVVTPGEGNAANAIHELIDQQKVSTIVLADIGKLVPGTQEELTNWLKAGGILIRFAGPRLEQGGDELLPSPLRRGGRSLGGSLSWSTPQPLAPFDEKSPFRGLAVPDDVKVNRQVLADPTMASDAEVWATLADGTPLVTAAKQGQGYIVLFHVTANSDWSNLPLSGLFVEMLRRVVTLGPSQVRLASDDKSASPEAPAQTVNVQTSSAALSPIQTLDGFGQLTSPPLRAAPIAADKFDTTVPGPDHPPGYYGPSGAARALNIVTAKTTLRPLKAIEGAVTGYTMKKPRALEPWLYPAAIAIFGIDVLAVLMLSTGLRLRRRIAATSAVVLLALLVLPNLARAAEAEQAPPKTGNPADDFALNATLQTHLAYVVTGDPDIDRTSEEGLSGLSKVLRARTALEPADPLGVDIDKDELSFFPILYWPVRDDAQPLSDATLAKIDAYMKQGGLIIFDTRDQGVSLTDSGAQNKALTRLIGQLDIPPLEPVPENHVLTKSFYLMRSFPGRYDGGALWVEAEPDDEAERSERSRRTDGVSSIVITSNDLASAWALDDANRPIYPTVPGGEVQREMAFRAGVNIVMYALTGNYKADQVHVPALLERLGQ
ncbi:DUF4159 domain-containing protein [Methyloceanibacter sp.]|uniref:DUF4159 domain-containing protein n=1 Tax=Methyloceanibacter sp. TaxID=1965321 RepID=UPI002D406EBE|nr:DUF4159 domain-containing protein [Methyloceanibacter sp.]HZP08154.1 DUF4159 domain-containing protein [Methyloceanibacter sp.]